MTDANASPNQPGIAENSRESRLDRSSLGAYRTTAGEHRAIVVCRRSDGSRLVIDCSTQRSSDTRLVAELDANEAPENARIVATLYLADPTRGHCRPVLEQDYHPASQSTAQAA